jgi:hypothetical protein
MDAPETASLKLNLHHASMQRQICQATLIMTVNATG